MWTVVLGKHDYLSLSHIQRPFRMASPDGGGALVVVVDGGKGVEEWGGI